MTKAKIIGALAVLTFSSLHDLIQTGTDNT
jgi:hypothetical protein